MAPPPIAITMRLCRQAFLIMSRSNSRNRPSPSSRKISAIGLPIPATISSSVSRKFKFNLRATSLATRDLPVPEKPVIMRLVICLSTFINYACQYIEKHRLEQELSFGRRYLCHSISVLGRGFTYESRQRLDSDERR